jgi:predicted nucleic acid-binding protein
VKVFLDTSVIVAAVRQADERNEVSRRLLLGCESEQACCAAHTLAEVYATLTGMRPPNRFRPEDAILVLEHVHRTLLCVSLTPDEVLETIHRTATLKLPGGIVYDAILLGCARKANAERIYTWNVRHFKMVAPDLTDRIVTP